MACAFCFCLDLFGYLEISQTSRLCRVSLPCLPKLKLRGQERAHTGVPPPPPPPWQVGQAGTDVRELGCKAHLSHFRAVT